MGTGREARAPFPAHPGRAMLRVTFELGKGALDVCLRRNRRPTQALPGGSNRPGGRGTRQPQRAERGGIGAGRDRRLAGGTPVAFEAAFGWGWLVELLEDYGFAPHLVHPLQCKAIASARLKNDKGRRGDLGAVAPRGPAAGGVDRTARGTAAALPAAA